MHCEYSLWERLQANLDEYDAVDKDAIGEETEQPKDTAGNLGRRKYIQTIAKSLAEEQELAPKDGSVVENKKRNRP